MKNWRKMLEAIGGYDNELVGIPSGGVKEMVEEIESLRQQLASRDAEIASLLLNYDSACMLVAEMHEAAVGMVVGPHHGVVEDVAYVRKERNQLREQVMLLRDVIGNIKNYAHKTDDVLRWCDEAIAATEQTK